MKSRLRAAAGTTGQRAKWGRAPPEVGEDARRQVARPKRVLEAVVGRPREDLSPPMQEARERAC